jgi:hypothetical protein
MRASHLALALLASTTSLPALASEINPNVTAGYSDGFFIRTDDDRYRLKIGSRVTFGYTESFVSPGNDWGKFEAVFAKFYAGGNAFGPNLQYYIQASAANNPRSLRPSGETSSTSGRFLLEDYYFRLNRSDFFVKAGKFKTPFGREWLVFPGNSEFVDRSAATQSFTFGREMGAVVGFEMPKTTFTAGIFDNGSDTTLGVGYDPVSASASAPGTPLAASTRGHGFLSVARLVVMPFGAAGYTEGDVENSEGSRLDVGVGAALDRGRDADFNWDKTLDDNVSVLALGSDLTWKRGGKSFQGEFFFRKTYGRLTADTKGMGFYAQPGIFLLPGKLELAGRFGWVDPNLDQTDDSVLEGAGAMNFYISGDHRYKTQLQYTWRGQEWPATGRNQNHFIDLMFQLTI